MIPIKLQSMQSFISRCKYQLVFFFMFSTYLTAFSQYEKDYLPIKSSGNIPEDFIKSASEKYQERINEVDKKGANASTEAELLLQSTFEIDDVLLSGKILYNDPMSVYCNKVVDKVLEANIDLRSKVKVYVIQVPYVNAFTTPEGYIFITTGLLAQIETEAQLAMVICHELTHYTEKHSLKALTEEKKYDQDDKEYKSLSKLDKIVAQSNFSIQNEKEADDKGLTLFLSTRYSTASVMGTFDVLQYSYLPFDDITFNKSFLENRTLKIPNNWLLTETKEISGNESNFDTEDEEKTDEDELYRTHPSIAERKSLLKDRLKIDNSNRSSYLVSESEMLKVREMARFELSYLYAIRHEYVKSIYNSYLLQRKYPDNLYLRKMISFSMSSLSAYASQNSLRDVVEKYKNIEGKQQSLYYLIEKLDSSSKIFNIYALAYCAEQRFKYPDDRDLNHYFDIAVRSLIFNTNLSYFDFSDREPIFSDSLNANTSPKDSNMATIPANSGTKEDEASLSKYDKIRKKETSPIGAEGKSSNFFDFAFTDYFQKDWFKNAFVKYKDMEDESIVENEKRAKDRKAEALKDFNKVVVLNPYYIEINERSDDRIKYLDAEQKEKELMGIIEKSAKINDIESVLFDFKGLRPEDSKKLNDYTFMQDYMVHDLQNGKEVIAPNINYDRAQDIMASYDSKYIALFGIISYTRKRSHMGGLVILSIVFPPSMILTIPAMVNNQKHTIFTSVVYNTDLGKVENFRDYDIHNRSSKSVLNSNIYDVFYTLKHQGKTKNK